LISNNAKALDFRLWFRDVEQLPIEIASNPHNENISQTKRDKMGHKHFEINDAFRYLNQGFLGIYLIKPT